MKLLDLGQSERKFYIWLVSNRYKILLILIVAFITSVIQRLAYFSIVFKTEFAILILTILISVVFNIASRDIVKVGLVLLLPAFFLQILDKSATAEFVGNIIYTLFLIGVFKGINSIVRED